MAMSTSSSRTVREAVDALARAFVNAGLDGVPMELQHLLLTYPTGPVGSHEEAKKKLYRRIYGILWFGSQMKLGKPSVAGQQPTYVYPPAIVSVVRARFPQGIKAHVNPTGPVVYAVTYKDLAAAKWPKIKK